MALKLDGKPLDISKAAWSVSTLSNFLHKSPTDEVFTGEHVAKALGVDYYRLRDNAKHPSLADLTATIGRNRFWGNPRAIKELKRQVGI